jgi:hypothetical protein
MHFSYERGFNPLTKCTPKYGTLPSGAKFSSVCGTQETIPKLNLAVGDVNMTIDLRDYCNYSFSDYTWN